MINKKRLFRLTRQLIKINSENPPGDESRIARFIKKYLQDLGVKTRIYEFKKGRSNVVARMGEAGERSLLISPHLDTVPAGRSWKRANPFSGLIRKGKLYGLGATDCKGNLACALEAINSLVEDKVALGYSLIFAATADEEAGSASGLIPLLDKGILKPDAAVILDSDDFSIIIAQKGLIHLKVKIRGLRAHGAYPDRGINAIDIAIGIINRMRKHKFVYSKNDYLKAPTINLGVIKGGDKVNIVADWCEFELDLRFLPGESAQRLIGRIRKEAEIQARKAGMPSGAARIEIDGVQQPYIIDRIHPLVGGLARAIRKAGARPRIKGSEGATVITFFQHKNIPAVATGFGSAGCAHAADEYVKIDNLYKGAIVLEYFLKNYKKVGK